MPLSDLNGFLKITMTRVSVSELHIPIFGKVSRCWKYSSVTLFGTGIKARTDSAPKKRTDPHHPVSVQVLLNSSTTMIEGGCLRSKTGISSKRIKFAFDNWVEIIYGGGADRAVFGSGSMS